MARPVLDPETAATDAVTERSFRLLPALVREFRHVPDPNEMLPGDVLLVTSESLITKAIRQTQAAHGFTWHHAQWTHVGLYIGDETVVDAHPKDGVSLRDVYEFTFRRRLLVRRLGRLDMVDRYRVVVRVMSELGKGYSRLGAVRLAANRLLGMGADDAYVGMLICSTLVADAYSFAVNEDFKPRSRDITWPADLSLTKGLDDQSVGWVRVADD